MWQWSGPHAAAKVYPKGGISVHLRTQKHKGYGRNTCTDTTETPQEHHKETRQRHRRNTTQTPQEHHTDTTETPLRHH